MKLVNAVIQDAVRHLGKGLKSVTLDAKTYDRLVWEMDQTSSVGAPKVNEPYDIMILSCHIKRERELMTFAEYCRLDLLD